MTAEEKAKQIIDSHYKLNDIESLSEFKKAIAYTIAKESAKISVDLLIESSGFKHINSYWHQVKQHIESM